MASRLAPKCITFAILAAILVNFFGVSQLFDRATNGVFDVREIGHKTMFGAHVNKVVNQGNKFCIVTNVSEVELLRAVQTLVATIDSLGQRALIEDIFSTVYKRVTVEQPNFVREPANVLTLHQAVTTIDAWLGRLATRNPELFVQVTSFLGVHKVEKPTQ